MVRPVINGPSLLETMMPTVSSDVTDSLSQTRVTFSAKPAPLDTPSSRPVAERQPGVHVSQILCVAILRQPLLRQTFETHREVVPGLVELEVAVPPLETCLW